MTSGHSASSPCSPFSRKQPDLHTPSGQRPGPHLRLTLLSGPDPSRLWCMPSSHSADYHMFLCVTRLHGLQWRQPPGPGPPLKVRFCSKRRWCWLHLWPCTEQRQERECCPALPSMDLMRRHPGHSAPDDCTDLGAYCKTLHYMCVVQRNELCGPELGKVAR